MTYQVEKGIPVPPSVKRVKNATYPFAAMTAVGDSFLVPCAEEDTKKIKARVASATSQFHMRHKDSGMRFAVRPVPGGVRAWRTA